MPRLFEDYNETGANFRIGLQVNVPGDIQGDVSLNVSINQPPADGTCTVTPFEGFITQTTFKAQCSGWNDADGVKELKIYSKILCLLFSAKWDLFVLPSVHLPFSYIYSVHYCCLFIRLC